MSVYNQSCAIIRIPMIKVYRNYPDTHDKSLLKQKFKLNLIFIMGVRFIWFYLKKYSIKIWYLILF